MGAEWIACCQCTLAPQLQVPESPPSNLDPQFETSLASKCLLKDRGRPDPTSPDLCLLPGLEDFASLPSSCSCSCRRKAHQARRATRTEGHPDVKSLLLRRATASWASEDVAFDLSMFDDIKASPPMRKLVRCLAAFNSGGSFRNTRSRQQQVLRDAGVQRLCAGPAI